MTGADRDLVHEISERRGPSLTQEAAADRTINRKRRRKRMLRRKKKTKKIKKRIIVRKMWLKIIRQVKRTTRIRIRRMAGRILRRSLRVRSRSS